MRLTFFVTNDMDMSNTITNQPFNSPSDTSDLHNNSTLNEAVQHNILQKLATSLQIKPTQVSAFIELYDAGATIPFIARYRKEKTQGLDDAQLRELEKSLNYEREMASRRGKIIELLSNQGKLTEELKKRIDNASSKLELEDIYLPYRPRRRSLAFKAKLAGLDEVAQRILKEEISPTDALASYQPPQTLTDEDGSEVDADFSDKEKQLAGVQAIIIEEWTQSLDVLDALRAGFAKTAILHSQVVSDEKREVGEKFKDYFDHSESLARLPNHRLLAMLRGRQENVLFLKVDGEDEPFIEQLIKHFQLQDKAPQSRQDFLQQAAQALWSDKWRPHIEHRLLTEKRLAAEANAIDVFANNLRHLLMAAPAGRHIILGVDPGIRHGVKMAIIDAQGHVATDAEGHLATATVYPFAPDNKMAEAKSTIHQLLKEHQVELIAVGNGTASRETYAMIKEIVEADDTLDAQTVMVNESGASVYSASELASEELSELDVSLRGAVSIARRLQDPLSELVKVEPKAIGVGQYQHDVNQTQLADSLDKVTQDCVNAVGVDVNTASPAILSHISGLNRNVAQQIVNYRKEHGAFSNREQLKNVPRLGVKTFEQAAGFLRIRDGENPLDATGVHPESYELVNQILAKTQTSLTELLGNDGILNGLNINELEAVNDNISIQSVLQELAKPAHDPRPEFKTAKFREGVNAIEDLEEDMKLEGVVTNVTAFGCFVDVGVHQDGLVHISEMANDFVQDPINRVKPGDIINVRVIGVDKERRRIAFSMKPEQAETQKESNHKPAKRVQKNNSTSNDTNRSAKTTKKASQSAKKRDKSKNTSGQSNLANKDVKKVGTLGELLKQAGL